MGESAAYGAQEGPSGSTRMGGAGSGAQNKWKMERKAGGQDPVALIRSLAFIPSTMGRTQIARGSITNTSDMTLVRRSGDGTH